MQVEVVQPPSAGAVAYAMLTIGTTSSDFYRFLITGSDLVAEKKIAGVKTDVSIPYDAAAHRFIRIRHDAATGQERWETAPGSGGVPGAWTQRNADTWQASVPVTALRVELKAGTSDPQASAGTVIFTSYARWGPLGVPHLAARSGPDGGFPPALACGRGRRA